MEAIVRIPEQETPAECDSCGRTLTWVEAGVEGGGLLACPSCDLPEEG